MLQEYQARVKAAMRSGQGIDDVDEAIIQPADLTDDQKSALWLFGWACQSRRRQRKVVAEMLTVVGS